MKNNHKYLLTLPLFVCAAPSQAFEIPKYDVEGLCERISAIERESNPQLAADRHNWCISREQSAYNHIKSAWDKISEDDQKKCIQYFEKNNDPMQLHYIVLESCVVRVLQHQESERNLHERDRFHY
jgi:hypothetical protein